MNIMISPISPFRKALKALAEKGIKILSVNNSYVAIHRDGETVEYDGIKCKVVTLYNTDEVVEFSKKLNSTKA